MGRMETDPRIANVKASLAESGASSVIYDLDTLAAHIVTNLDAPPADAAPSDVDS